MKIIGLQGHKMEIFIAIIKFVAILVTQDNKKKKKYLKGIFPMKGVKINISLK